jgi:hypothetical protein
MLHQLLSLLESFDYLLLEDKVDFIVTRQGAKLFNAYGLDRGAGKPKLDDAAGVVAYLAKNISEKHLQRLANWYQQNEFSLEDAARIKDELARFDKLKPKLEKKDLNQYKTLTELDEVLSKFTDDDEKSNRQLDRERESKFFKDKEAKLFYEDADLKIVIPLTQEASVYFGRGTKWCTAAEKNNMFSYYSKRTAPLYIVMCRGGDKYQFHFKSGQFMDSSDRQINLGELASTHPSLYVAFEKEAKKWGMLNLIDPKKWTDEVVTAALDRVIKANKNYHREIFIWINKNLAKPEIKLGKETVQRLITCVAEMYHEGDRNTGSIFRNCVDAFLKLEPKDFVELVEQAKDDNRFLLTTLTDIFNETAYINRIYEDKSSFKKLIDIIVARIRGDGSYVDNYIGLLKKAKTLYDELDLQAMVPAGFFDELAIKYGNKYIGFFGYTPPEAVQLKMVEHDPEFINDMPYATNRVKERARMYARAKTTIRY